MFCKNCGKALTGTPDFCPHCGARPLLGNSFCQGCGAPITPLTEICMKCGTRIAKAEVGRASWGWLALAIFVGWIGGLIAYFTKRKQDPFRAKVFLWVGIGVSCVYIPLIILTLLGEL